MGRKFVLMTLGGLLICFLQINPSWGGSLADLEGALDHYYLSGEISNDDAYQILSDMIIQAKASPDAETETALRSSFRDIVSSFNGSGISNSAAQNLNSIAQP